MLEWSGQSKSMCIDKNARNDWSMTPVFAHLGNEVDSNWLSAPDESFSL